MELILKLFSSSVGKKILMASSGILIVLFLIVHFMGNLFLFVGEEAFNRYAYFLSKNHFIFMAMEIVLLLLFLWHISLGIYLYFQGKKARPNDYVMRKHSGRGATWASSTMPYTGTLILLFCIVHVSHLRFGPVTFISYDGIQMRNLYTVVVDLFSSLKMVSFYILSMMAIALHLSHGFQSAFQSVGVNHPRYSRWIENIGSFMVILVAGGFSAFPLWIYINGGH